MASAAAGLLAPQKWLPRWLLAEPIDRLDHGALRAREAILQEHAPRLLELATAGQRTSVVELEARVATSTAPLLGALVARQRDGAYFPVDLSESALHLAREWLARRLPTVRVDPWCCTPTEALGRLESIPGRRLVVLPTIGALTSRTPRCCWPRCATGSAPRTPCSSVSSRAARAP